MILVGGVRQRHFAQSGGAGHEASIGVPRSPRLVTGDQDLLFVAGEAPLPILLPRAAWELLAKTK